MKKTTVFVIVIIILALLLSACASATPASKTAEPMAAIATTEPNAPQLYPVDDTKTMLENIIFGQHTLDFIFKEKRTAEEWDKLIDRMIGYGCSIKPEQKGVIIDWLVEQQK